MRKAKLIVTEKLEYRREIIVNVPDEMSEDELNRALNRAEREEFLSDFIYTLGEHGIRLAENYDDSLDSPDTSEVECEEYDFLENAEGSTGDA